MTSIGEKIAIARKNKNLSQTDLAKKVNMTPQMVSKWERDESLPDVVTLGIIADILGVSINYFYDEETPTNNNAAPEKNEGFLTIRFNAKTAVKVLKYVFLGIGLLFLATGLGFFLGFTVPETRNLEIAQNESLPIITAEVTESHASSSRLNGDRMYYIEFEWTNGTGKSNAIYTKDEAAEMVGEFIEIRVDGDRAVMVDYSRSVLSMLGYIFIGVFGGLGAAFLITSVILFIYARHQQSA